MRSLVTAALAGAALVPAAPAFAAAVLNSDGSVTFSSAVGANTVNVAYNGLAGDPKALVPGLSGKMTLTLSSIVSNRYNFSYTFTNSSTVAGTRISGFGFDIDSRALPYLSAVGAGTTDIFDLSSLNANFASIGADVCFNGGPGSCPESNPAHSLNYGATTSGTFSLTFTPGQSAVTLSNFVDRYQGFSTRNVNNQAVSSAIGEGTVTAVPESATWAMMLLGFAGIGSIMRRSRRGANVLAQLA